MVAATAVGAAAQRRGPSREPLARLLLAVMLFAITPIVVFFNVARLHFDANIGAGIVLGWIALLLTAALAWAATRGRDRVVTGTVIVGAIQANTGYLGYPLTSILLGSHRLPQAVAYDLLVSVPMLFTVGFGVGAAYGTRAGEGAAARLRAYATRNPLLLAFVLGLIAPNALAPDGLVTASRVLVFAMLPLGFFAVGVHLAASLPARVRVPPLSREVAIGVSLRLVVAPLLLLLLALPLIDLPGPYLLLAAMPCGINTLLVVNEFGLDRGLAAGLIAWSTAIVLVAVLVASALR